LGQNPRIFVNPDTIAYVREAEDHALVTLRGIANHQFDPLVMESADDIVRALGGSRTPEAVKQGEQAIVDLMRQQQSR